ncbi:ATP-binding protein [Salinibacterium sp. SYSU T00001]|uniref:sensor histidine kinase n=1 Tax=Homoserinimonas sedimenticola TaxID=2986805 RepID=UPI002235AC43|nr:ATP-binding protein [Salinibacterium sedimenticola]MCW4385177.1 ATP-binding protein [Salinibacterium sedimenticola]
MSVGLPAHLTSRALSTALSRAAHGMAYAAIISGTVISLGFAAAYPDRTIWPALFALLAMVPMVVWVQHSRRIVAGLVYLAVGALAAFIYTLTFAAALPELVATSTLWLAPPKIVLVLVAGAGAGLVRAVTWTLGGYVVAETSVFLALSQVGLPAAFDLLTFALVVEAIGVCLLAFLSTRNAVRTHPRLQRAAREELLDDLRARMELRAAALMHDTILSHLAAIASSSEQRLSPQQAELIERDLQVLIGQEWLHSGADVTADVGADDRASPLRDAITEVRAQGLEVTGTGDFGSVMRLSAEQAVALGLAAKQCLVNVIKHSGVMKAEVAVYASEDEVSVMIIDAGRGFSDSSVGSDRLGLRASVQSRIQSVGGMVQVWSTPGSGTSILIQLPVGASSTAAATTAQQPLVSGPLPTIEESERPSDEGTAS